MDSSRPIIGKSRSISATQSPDHLLGTDRRTPRSSILSSPENHHHQAQQRRPLMRSSSDVSKMSKNQEQISGATAAAKRQPIRKPIERSPSLQGNAAQTTVKERLPRTSPATVSRPTVSAKLNVEKASTSRVVSRTVIGSTQPVSKTKTAVGLTKKKSAVATSTANKNEKSAVVVSENENNETSSNFVVIKKLDESSGIYVSEFSGVNGSEQPENHAKDVDEEPNHVNESQEKEEYINKSKNSIETTAAQENKIELEQNSKVIGHAEDNEEMVEPSSKTADTIDETVSIANADAIEEAVGTLTIAKKSEIVHGMRTETPKINEVIEETKNKLFEHRKSKVKALVGAFETVMS